MTDNEIKEMVVLLMDTIRLQTEMIQNLTGAIKAHTQSLLFIDERLRDLEDLNEIWRNDAGSTN